MWVRVLPFQKNEEKKKKKKREKRKKKKRMLRKRVTKRKRGYQTKKVWVEFKHLNQHGREWIEKRTEEGYLLGWTKEKEGVKVYLRYTKEGVPSLTKRKRRWKPSRSVSVDASKRWGTKGDVGRYRRETTKGRKTNLEARKENVGGVLCRWVK